MKITAVIKLIWLTNHSNNVMKQFSIAAVAVAILMGAALTTTKCTQELNGKIVVGLRV